MVRGNVDDHSDVDLLVTLAAGKTGLAPGAERGAAVVKTGPQSDLALLDHILARIVRIEECTNRERSDSYGALLVQELPDPSP